MKIQKIITCTILLLIFYEAQAQTDSLQIMSAELEKAKSELASRIEEDNMREVWKRKKYWRFGAGLPDLECTEGITMIGEANFSCHIQRGRTVYFHRKPIGGKLKFGIDYGLIDLNYTNLKLNPESVEGIGTRTNSSASDGFDDIVSERPGGLLSDSNANKLEYGLLIGPSITVNPWNHLMVAAYFRVKPTVSGILTADNIAYGFGISTSAGISVSYKAISVGVEGLWGAIKYTQATFNDEAEDTSELLNKEGQFKLKQKGPRFYIAIKL